MKQDQRFSQPPSSVVASLINDESIALITATTTEGSDGDIHRYGSTGSTDTDEDSSSSLASVVKANEKKILQDEIINMIQLALPVVITSLLEIFPGICTSIIVGRADYGDDQFTTDEGGGDGDNMSKSALYMTAASLATMFVNIIAFSTGLGLLGAMDTLCSAAHGAGAHSKMGTYLLTGMAIMSLLSILVTVIILQTENALLFLNQPYSVSNHAGVFAMWLIPGIPFLYAYELLRKISQARGEVVPMMLAAIVSNVVVVGVGFYLVNYTDWGWLGAAWARSLGSMVSLPCIIFGMMWCGDAIEDDDDDDKDNNSEPSKEFMLHLWEGFHPARALNAKAISTWLGLGIPGMLQIMFEWVAWEVIALLCGILPGEERAIIAIGSSAIVNNISGLTFMAYEGISVAGNVRIGGALGAGDAHRAQMASYLTMSLGGCLSMVNMVMIFSFRKMLPYLFNTDELLVRQSERLFIVAAIYQFPDAINCVGQGVLAASGRQALGAKLNFAAYYLLGLPLGYVLGVGMDTGVEGLWWGMTVGLFAIATANVVYVFKSDWKALSLETRRRMSIAPADNVEA